MELSSGLIEEEEGIYLDDQSDLEEAEQKSSDEERLADFDDEDCPEEEPTSDDEEIEKFKRPDRRLFSFQAATRRSSTDVGESSDILSCRSVESYLSEAGLSVSLIDRNDKKFIKINIAGDSGSSGATRLNKPPTTEASPGLKLVEMLDLTAQKCSPSGQSDEMGENGMVFSEKDLEKLLGLSAAEFNSQLDNIECQRLFEAAENEAKPADDEPIQLRFICAKCDERFELESELAQHLTQTHSLSGSKRFDCGVCGMSFYDMSSKNRHEKEHAGLKPFRCYICSFEFTRASNLRAHLLKLHPGQIGKSVKISKTIDNKLQFEFNLDLINQQKEQQSRLQSVKVNDLSNLAPFAKSSRPKSTSFYVQNKTKYGYKDKCANELASKSNAVIYIKDPSDKNGLIQHMVVYVDGKPIFVKSPILNDATKSNMANEAFSSADASHNKKPAARIPYLLARAAATAASNHREQQQLKRDQSYLNYNDVRLESDQRMKSSRKRLHSQISDPKEDAEMEQDYVQLVSMFKQKNQKLATPMFK